MTPNARPNRLPLSTPSAAGPGLPRRRWLQAAFGLAAGLALPALSGCGGAETEDTGWLRVVNASIDYPTADLWLDGSLSISGLANGGTTSSYQQVTAGDVQVAWHAAGSSTAKLSMTRTVATDSRTTVVCLGTLASGLSFKAIDESNDAPGSSQVKLRVLHAASTLEAVDVYVTNTDDLSGLTPTASVSTLGELSSFVTVTAGDYRVRVTLADDRSTVLYDLTAQVGLTGGTVVTLAVVPRASGSLPDVTALPEQLAAVRLPNELV